MTPEERAVAYAKGLTPTHRHVLLVRLDRPHLTVAELAEAVGYDRSTVQRALAEGRRRELLGGPQPCTEGAAAVHMGAAAVHMGAAAVQPPEAEGAAAVQPALPCTTEIPTPPSVGQAQLALDGMATEQPIEQPKPKRKGTPLTNGTGLSRPELRQLAEACRQAREFEGLDVRLWDRQRAEATCAACLRRGMAGAEIVAWAPKVPAFSRGSIELAMNQGATAPKRKRPITATVGTAEQYAAEAAAFDQEAAIRSLTGG